MKGKGGKYFRLIRSRGILNSLLLPQPEFPLCDSVLIASSRLITTSIAQGRYPKNPTFACPSALTAENMTYDNVFFLPGLLALVASPAPCSVDFSLCSSSPTWVQDNRYAAVQVGPDCGGKGTVLSCRECQHETRNQDHVRLKLWLTNCGLTYLSVINRRTQRCLHFDPCTLTAAGLGES